MAEFHRVAVLYVQGSVLSDLGLEQMINLHPVDEANGHVKARGVEGDTLQVGLVGVLEFFLERMVALD